MKKRGIFLAIFLIIFSVSFVAGSYKYYGEDIITSYSGGENVRGSIIISLNNENANSAVTSSYAGSISLIDLIKANGYTSEDYDCSSVNCGKNYKANGDTNQLDINLDNNKKLIGIYFEGREVYVRNADFSISSNAGLACSKQISIDVGDEDKILLQNTLYNKEAICSDSKNWGCFDNSLNSGSYSKLLITQEGVCERINLREAPAYEFGAFIENTTNGVKGDLKIELFNNETTFIGECNLPQLDSNIGEKNCIVEKPILENEDYYACISLKGGSAKYQIRAESSGQVCGTGDILGNKEGDFDYEIFAKPLPYDFIKNLSLASAFKKTTGDNFEDYLDDYISQNYERNCSSGCVVPIAFQGVSQHLDFSNISIEYDASPGNVVTKNILKEITQSDSKISSGNLTLELAYAKFKTPNKTNNNKSDFNLFIGGKSVFGSPIKIDLVPGFDFNVNPKFAFIGIQTRFSAVTNDNITSSVWKFGNGEQKNGIGKRIDYTYTSQGNYTIDVSLTNSKGFTARKTFDVVVGNASESAKILLNSSKVKLNKIKTFSNSQPIWIQNYISKRLNITEAEKQIGFLESSLNSSKNESEYTEIVLDLVGLNLPESFKVPKKGILPFSLGFSRIDVSYIENISNYKVSEDKRELLKENIIFLNDKNYASQISFEDVSIISGLNEESIYTKIKITPARKGTASVNKDYLIIDYPIEQITFSKDYKAGSIQGDYKSGTYIALSGEDIEFILTGKVNFIDLGAYISPIVSEVGDYEEPIFISKKYPTLWVSFWLILVVIFTLVIYIVLQEWYKKYYQSYLFKNGDDLYNLINFIYNSRNSKLSDDIIRKKLSVNKWSGEQIDYAIKKLDGRRTGMFEIPIFRGREQKKIMEEIAKRQPEFRDGKIY
jgi:PKD repeat protein